MTDIYYQCTTCKTQRKATQINIKPPTTEYKCSVCSNYTKIKSGYT